MCISQVFFYFYKTFLNSRLVSDIYVGDDGKLHKVQGGADSVLPFRSNHSINVDLLAGAQYTLPIKPEEVSYIAAFGRMGNITALRTYKVGHGYDYRGTDGIFKYKYSNDGFVVSDTIILFTVPTVFGATTGTWTFMWD